MILFYLQFRKHKSLHHIKNKENKTHIIKLLFSSPGKPPKISLTTVELTSFKHPFGIHRPSKHISKWEKEDAYIYVQGNRLLDLFPNYAGFREKEHPKPNPCWKDLNSSKIKANFSIWKSVWGKASIMADPASDIWKKGNQATIPVP